jgi:hypothetical protein
VTHTFDERGEAAIVNLRRDPRFNEALYRKFGPVKYWTQVREAEERVAHLSPKVERSRETRAHEYLRRAQDNFQVEPGGHPTRKEYEDEMSKLGPGLPLEKASQKDRSRTANLAAAIVMIALALAAGGVIVTIAAMLCYGAWSFIF